MAYFKALILLAAVFALALAAEEAPRTKKDVLVASPYAAVPVSYAFDDGSYYPGKYERTAYVSAAIPAVPAAYSAYPYAYSAYSAYPFRSYVAV
ncbi:uncharacterized protein [Halyomorpha halys]|uniref:uncharacterized protein n=1 Tax=Halyomorpha halys TaxID=286706 RepID=UPI0006D501B6|nr:uncharacterized protein LOC106693030 [Halyomorpha halys]